MPFMSSWRNRCLLIIWRIVKKNLCFAIFKERSFELHYSYIYSEIQSGVNLGEKKNGGFLELILQGLTYPIWVFSVSLMKVYQICYLTVKDSFKSMNAVRNNSPIINTGVIDESPSFFLLCIFQKIIIIFERLSLINGTKLRHADFTIT